MGAAVAAALAATLATSQGAFAAEPWAYSTLLDKTGSDEVSKVVFAEDGKGAVAFDQEGKDHPVQLFPGGDSELVQELRKRNVAFAVAPRPTPGAVASVLGTIGGVLLNFAPLLLLIGLNVLASRGGPGGAGGGGGGPMGQMQVGKSRSQIQMEPNTGVTFDDVAGCDGSKQELAEVVDFLKQPESYTKNGCRIPRGLILEGPPGTGKTLLARAVAGEAGVPFFAVSGSEFVEMFVGVGASRVRDVFGQAKKNAPCIIFIDEIDAVGRQRGGGQGGGNDEREQTLNQILVEMDGFDGNPGIITIAATNRIDILDSALLRPGRFDRKINVALPDFKGRAKILAVHSRGKPLEPDVDLEAIARRTPGYSGAQLENLMNESAISSARAGKSTVGWEQIDRAVDRLMVGAEKKGGISTLSMRQNELVAYHEAGHAVVGALIPDYDQVQKISIVPRSNGAGGLTFFAPQEGRLEAGLYSKQYLESSLAVALGGRLAEEIIFGEDMSTTGASNDFERVASTAKQMVKELGMSQKVGAVMIGPPPQMGMQRGPQWGLKKLGDCDAEVERLVNNSYIRAKRILEDNRPLLDHLAVVLCDQEVVSAEEFAMMQVEFDAKVVDFAVIGE